MNVMYIRTSQAIISFFFCETGMPEDLAPDYSQQVLEDRDYSVASLES
jgi:hypothetical protein